MMVAVMGVALITLGILLAMLMRAFVQLDVKLQDEERKCAGLEHRANALDVANTSAYERIKELVNTAAAMEDLARNKANECVKLKAALSKARRKKVSA